MTYLLILIALFTDTGERWDTRTNIINTSHMRCEFALNNMVREFERRGAQILVSTCQKEQEARK